jgi:hypothetical protein
MPNPSLIDALVQAQPPQAPPPAAPPPAPPSVPERVPLTRGFFVGTPHPLFTNPDVYSDVMKDQNVREAFQRLKRSFFRLLNEQAKLSKAASQRHEYLRNFLLQVFGDTLPTFWNALQKSANSQSQKTSEIARPSLVSSNVKAQQPKVPRKPVKL